MSKEQFLRDIFVMDGKGIYVWSVLLVFLLVIFINLYFPYRSIKRIKKDYRRNSENRE